MMGSIKDHLLGGELYQLPEPAPAKAFGGETYNSQWDYSRLKGQLAKVFDFMCDGQWHTLAEIHAVVGGSEAAVSARLRDLRKDQYGAFDIQRQSVSEGLFRYRLNLGGTA